MEFMKQYQNNGIIGTVPTEWNLCNSTNRMELMEQYPWYTSSSTGRMVSVSLPNARFSHSLQFMSHNLLIEFGRNKFYQVLSPAGMAQRLAHVTDVLCSGECQETNPGPCNQVSKPYVYIETP